MRRSSKATPQRGVDNYLAEPGRVVDQKGFDRKVEEFNTENPDE